MDAPSGLLIAGKRTPLPLRDVSIQAEVTGYVLGLKSILKYYNDSSDPVEVLFRFPLEQSHAVVGLTALIDGRKIKAQIREKEEARARYDDAIASGQTAALGEEKSGDVFSISLGNLPPQKEAEIHLQLVGELPVDAEGSVRFSLPSTLKPRYTPTGASDPLAPVPSGEGDQVEHASVSGVHGFQLNVLSAEDIAEVTSPTHSISVTPGGDKTAVSLSEEKPLSKDLVILIKHKKPHEPKAIVESGRKGENDFMSSPAVMINFFPEFASVEAACEFIFLVDRSGSMGGSYIRSAGETLVLFLKSLPEGSYFNIIGFGSSYEKLFKESVPYSQDTLDKATKHAQTVTANLGGTELLPPLRHIFSVKALSGLPRQVFVLTDGSVSNTDSCIQEVKKNVNTARCFTFGIGSGASSALVEGLARAGNGTAEFVKEGERMQPKVIRSLKRALQPAISDVSVEFKDVEVLQSPQNLPPIFNGEKLVVYGILKSKAAAKFPKDKGSAVLKGVMLGKHIHHSVPFKLQPVEPAQSLPSIHHLAGKALISDWQQNRRDKNDIVKLSIESSVISTHTAFVAVDEESSEAITGAIKTWDIRANQFGAMKSRNIYMNATVSFDSALDSDDDSDEEFEDVSENMVLESACVMERGSMDFEMDGREIEMAYTRRSASLLSSDDELAGESPPVLMQVAPLPLGITKGAPAPRGITKGAPAPRGITKGAPKGADTLSSIITIQQANGSWKLDGTLAQLLSMTQETLEGNCPAECRGIMAAVWATVLVLTLLRMKYSSQQEEWELIAMKAETWVKRQTLPAGVTMDGLDKAASILLA